MMNAVTLVNQMALRSLLEIAANYSRVEISDRDFMEVLAQRKCILVPPWIVRVRPDGGTERVGVITYDQDLNLDKAKILQTVQKDSPHTTRRRVGHGRPRHKHVG